MYALATLSVATGFGRTALRPPMQESTPKRGAASCHRPCSKASASVLPLREVTTSGVQLDRRVLALEGDRWSLLVLVLKARREALQGGRCDEDVVAGLSGDSFDPAALLTASPMTLKSRRLPPQMVPVTTPPVSRPMPKRSSAAGGWRTSSAISWAAVTPRIALLTLQIRALSQDPFGQCGVDEHAEHVAQPFPLVESGHHDVERLGQLAGLVGGHHRNTHAEVARCYLAGGTRSSAMSGRFRWPEALYGSNR